MKRLKMNFQDGGGLGAADVETADEAVFDMKDVADHLIHEQIAIEIVNDLMDFDDNLALRSLGECDRLDMRVDHGPLPGPIAADSIASVNVAAFHAVGPHHVFMQSGEDGLHVTRVESVVEALEEVDLIDLVFGRGHSRINYP